MVDGGGIIYIMVMVVMDCWMVQPMVLEMQGGAGVMIMVVLVKNAW